MRDLTELLLRLSELTRQSVALLEKSLSSSQNLTSITEPEVPLPLSLDPTAGLYPEPDECRKLYRPG